MRLFRDWGRPGHYSIYHRTLFSPFALSLCVCQWPSQHTKMKMEQQPSAPTPLVANESISRTAADSLHFSRGLPHHFYSAFYFFLSDSSPGSRATLASSVVIIQKKNSRTPASFFFRGRPMEAFHLVGLSLHSALPADNEKTRVTSAHGRPRRGK